MPPKARPRTDGSPTAENQPISPTAQPSDALSDRLLSLQSQVEGVLRQLDKLRLLDEGDLGAARTQASRRIVKIFRTKLAPIACRIVEAVPDSFEDKPPDPRDWHWPGSSVAERTTGLPDEADAGKRIVLWTAMSLPQDQWLRPRYWLRTAPQWQSIFDGWAGSLTHPLEPPDPPGTRWLGQISICVRQAMESLIEDSYAATVKTEAAFTAESDHDAKGGLVDGTHPPNLFALDGKTCELPPKAFAIVDALWPCDNHSMPTWRLCERVWPDNENADGALRSAIRSANERFEVAEIAASLHRKNDNVVLEILAIRITRETSDQAV